LGIVPFLFPGTYPKVVKTSNICSIRSSHRPQTCSVTEQTQIQVEPSLARRYFHLELSAHIRSHTNTAIEQIRKHDFPLYKR